MSLNFVERVAGAGDRTLSHRVRRAVSRGVSSRGARTNNFANSAGYKKWNY
jgi:hypothetical protein